MEQKRKMKQLLAGAVKEARPRTLVELLGAERLVIEHHMGLLGYGEEEITVRGTGGMLVISGEDLKLCCMSREQLCIRGRIHRLELVKGE